MNLWYPSLVGSDAPARWLRKEPLSEACNARTLARAGLSSPSLTKGFFYFRLLLSRRRKTAGLGGDRDTVGSVGTSQTGGEVSTGTRKG